MKTLTLFVLCLFMALNGFSQSANKPADTTDLDIEIESSFRHGDRGWAKFLGENLYYPDSAVRKNIEGTVVVQFIVDKEGNITDIKAISGPEELRPAAESVMRKSPKWIPAQRDGKNVKSYKKQPITFRLK